ncbi:MAG: TetR/AcrR family transcriptional regulator [Bacteroidetes bacterium]|nr:TetR/AcrR family transcriptional regulator [Bacteroidota bacterium]
MSKDSHTEEKIKIAAKRVFIQKGFSGCTSREIAKEAGTNVALVNYYFRSKNQLFVLIYQSVTEEFLLSMVDVFSSNITLKEKINKLVDREFEFLAKHPEIPMFVINEMSRNKNAGIEPQGILSQLGRSGIFEETLEAQKNGIMRKLDLSSIIMLVMANCQHPFMARLLNQQLNNLSDEEYSAHLVKYKEVVKEMLLNYLFIQKD